MTLRDMGLALMVIAIWGINFSTAKAGVAEIPPLLMTTLRFMGVALLLLPFVRMPRGRMGAIVGVSITLGGLHFGLMFGALPYVPSSTASVVIQLEVPISAVLAWMVDRERLGWQGVLGLAVSFCGVLLIAGQPDLTGSLPALGVVLLAGTAWAVANLQIKRLSGVDPLALSAWTALFAAPQLAAASWLLEDGQLDALANAGWRGWGALAYMIVFSTIVAYTLWYKLVGRYGVSRTVPWVLLVPVFGVLGGVYLLGEPLGWELLAGGVLVVGGVAVVVIRPGTPAPAPAAHGGEAGPRRR
ncbi:MAG TPA: EamA family transporter [Alphaproteobacteria bacterium]|nr:EamA family transporter [Alphaproteobacteria bacterium]